MNSLPAIRTKNKRREKIQSLPPLGQGAWIRWWNGEAAISKALAKKMRACIFHNGFAQTFPQAKNIKAAPNGLTFDVAMKNGYISTVTGAVTPTNCRYVQRFDGAYDKARGMGYSVDDALEYARAKIRPHLGELQIMRVRKKKAPATLEQRAAASKRMKKILAAERAAGVKRDRVVVGRGSI